MFATVLNASDKIQVDGEFTCLEPWSAHTIMEDDRGLYIECAEGRHYLDAQFDTGRYVGIYGPLEH